MSEFVGMEKLSLVDFDSKIVCTLFSSGCNFNCAFCHNSPLIEEVKDNYLKFEEIIAYLKSRKNMLDGVCITGGEPTLMDDLKEKIIQIKELGLLVKLDTNGTNPRILKELIEEKLIDYVAMDIKNSLEEYHKICRVECVNLDAITESINILMASNIDYEFRTTLIDEYHNTDNILKIGSLIKGTKKYFLQKYTYRDTCPLVLHEVKKEKALEFQSLLSKYIESVNLRGY